MPQAPGRRHRVVAAAPAEYALQTAPTLPRRSRRSSPGVPLPWRSPSPAEGSPPPPGSRRRPALRRRDVRGHRLPRVPPASGTAPSGAERAAAYLRLSSTPTTSLRSAQRRRPAWSSKHQFRRTGPLVSAPPLQSVVGGVGAALPCRCGLEARASVRAHSQSRDDDPRLRPGFSTKGPTVYRAGHLLPPPAARPSVPQFRWAERGGTGGVRPAASHVLVRYKGRVPARGIPQHQGPPRLSRPTTERAKPSARPSRRRLRRRSWLPAPVRTHVMRLFLSRNAFPITDTELSDIAAAASIGDNNHPSAG